MWLELGIPRLDNPTPSPTRTWINTDHIVRVDFTQDGAKLSATVITTKPGGSDRSMFQGDDAERLRMALVIDQTWRPLLDFEKPAEEPKKKAKK